jgi:hypothetical protein
MSSRMTIADLPERYRDDIVRQLGGGKPLGLARHAAVKAVEIVVTGEPRLRQKTAPKLNKTETAWRDYLRTQYPTDTIHEQAITLQIGNGVRYTPDFIVTYPAGLATEGVCVMAYEVKGHMRDDAAVKLKVAARAYPWIGFTLVSRKGGTWQTQEILA